MHMPPGGVWNLRANPQSDKQQQLLEMSLPSQVSTVGLACDSSPFNDASTMRNKSKNPYSKSSFSGTRGIPLRRSTLELECDLLPLNDTCKSLMKGTSQALHFSPLYNRYNSYTDSTECSNERCTERSVFSSTGGINEYRKNQIVDYSNPCTCQENFYHCYNVFCTCGDHLPYPNPPRLEQESQNHDEALRDIERRHRMQQISKQYHFPPRTEEVKATENDEKTNEIERRHRMQQLSKQCHFPPRTEEGKATENDEKTDEIERRHRMRQISKQCHFPPPIEEGQIAEYGEIERRRHIEQISKPCHFPPSAQKGLSAYHDTVFEQQRQYFSTEFSQTPVRSDLTTAEINSCLTQKPDFDNNFLGIHTHAQCYLETLKNDYKGNKGKPKRRKRERKRKVTSPQPIHSLVKKGFRVALQKGRKFQKKWIKDQKSLCQELLIENEDVKTKKTTTSDRLEQTCDPETFICSTSSSHETSNGNTLLTNNQDGHNPLRAFPSENSVSTETIYEDDTAYSRDYGGYSFGHNYLPRIVAVHSIIDCQNQKHTQCWDKFRGAKELFLTEKMWNKLDGLSSNNGGGSHKGKREQSSTVSILKQNLPENYQAQFEQSAIHTDGNSVTIHKECTDHNKELEIPLLTRNKPGIFTEKKPHNLLNDEAIRELCHKIESYEERIKKETIPYKLDILNSIKKVLITRLRNLQEKLRNYKEEI